MGFFSKIKASIDATERRANQKRANQHRVAAAKAKVDAKAAAQRRQARTDAYEAEQREKAAQKARQQAQRSQAVPERQAYAANNKHLIDTMYVSGRSGQFKWDDEHRYFTLPGGLLAPDYVIHYDNVISYRIDEDVTTTSHTDATTKQQYDLGRSITGGIVGGKPGAAYGMFHGDQHQQSWTTTKQQVKRTIVINQRDSYSPVIKAEFNDRLVMKLDEIMQTRGATGTVSVADELLKLKALLDAGALTQAEFDQQKAWLLK